VFHPLGLTSTAYRQFWWYDKIAHVVGATVVGSVVAAVCVAWRTSRSRPGGGLLWSSSSHSSITRPATERGPVGTGRLLVVTAAGIVLLGSVWEVYELAVGYLTVYGVWDTVADAVANSAGGLGAVLVLRDSLVGLGQRIALEWQG
jgi:hypothetical protein